MNKFQILQNELLDNFNEFLRQQLMVDVQQTQLQEGMLYSLMAGGKRLRPFLFLATLASLKPQQKLTNYFKVAGAIELVHTYSLIHDDLPEMDNDDYRRGRLTNHKRFTTGRAVLAGDGLLTHAFVWLTDNDLNSKVKVKLVKVLAQAAGVNGMVAGQMTDIVQTGHALSLEQVARLDRQKTGALIQASVQMGAVCMHASTEYWQRLTVFAANYGLAFQIYDDLLDILSTQSALGKDVGKDQLVGKNTYPQVLGVTEAKSKLQQTLDEARLELATLNLENSPLADSLAYFQLEAK
ncbi:polyprenyl synthetase family protein [Bombilactobacillus folatiphilus]|uniref:Polyprenyl synthetase family protein n=1 Tax=Bombilactobacillus folatiphilus TaxID=2923362 RepID=A0ABY4P7W9_9LACO|nr:farnesyl diphosphate synthase [Bombilactobacillus folatiphilus]UQS81624.1 polyprenyl synthetase family protein [Bombilactobacillus folatiphilus]